MSVDQGKVQRMAREIDARYDAMLYEGMSMQAARQVEDERSKAHQLLAQAVLELASQ